MSYRRAIRYTQAQREAPKSSSAALENRDYDSMEYAEIRTLAMSYGISGKQTREALIAALENRK